MTPIHRLQPGKDRPLCRTKETGPYMTEDPALVNCPACRKLSEARVKGRVIKAGRFRA